MQGILKSVGLFSAMLIGGAGTAGATIITNVVPTTLEGPGFVAPGRTAAQGAYQAYDTSGNLAYSGGLAGSAIASSTITFCCTDIHKEEFANDGFYGNGRSWIANGPNSWLKLDLGVTAVIDKILFGRDRIGAYNDRDPGQFLIEYAMSDAVFASGNSDNDASEYSLALDSSTLLFSGTTSPTQSVSVDFETAPITARFLKLTFANAGTAIDEVEVFGTAVPAPATLALFGLGLAGLGWSKRKKI